MMAMGFTRALASDSPTPAGARATRSPSGGSPGRFLHEADSTHHSRYARSGDRFVQAEHGSAHHRRGDRGSAPCHSVRSSSTRPGAVVWPGTRAMHTSGGVRPMSPVPSDRPAGAVGPKEFRAVMAGLLLVLTLASLDQNIVATALPGIVSELGGLAHLSWVVTAFLVASTATTPLYGKLSDIYGRKRLFFVAVGIFLVGSALCGLSRDMTQLIIFRAVQGLGAGGLITLSQTTVGDLLSPRERGRYQGLFTAVFAACSVAGPLLGGFLTDALSWRWIFYINLPVGAVALGLIAVALPPPRQVVHHRIDFFGAFLLTLGTVCTILVLTLDSTREAWSRPGTWLEAG